MGQIIKFPAAISYGALLVRGGHRHTISVRINDRVHPSEARWHLQFAMQRAASFRCLSGFTDVVARRGGWHRFKVNRTDLARRFLIDIERLVIEGRASVVVDGVRVHLATRKAV